MSQLLTFAIGYLLTCIVVAMVLCTVRLLIGPRSHDRVLALDTLWMCAMLLTLGLGLRDGSQIYFDVAVLIALVSFVSSIALAKFLMRGEVIE